MIFFFYFTSESTFAEFREQEKNHPPSNLTWKIVFLKKKKKKK